MRPILHPRKRARIDCAYRLDGTCLWVVAVLGDGHGRIRDCHLIRVVVGPIEVDAV